MKTKPKSRTRYWRLYSRRRYKTDPSFRKRNKAATRRWEKANPDKKRTAGKNYRAKNKAKIARRNRRYRKANAEHIEALKQAWYYKNRTAILARRRKNKNK